MYKLLWLDDLRDPSKYKSIIEYLTFEFLEVDADEVEVIWVKTQKEFIKWIEENDLPDIISFDNDLGIGNGEGYDCAKWLVNYCNVNLTELPYYYVHSMNTVARVHIEGLLDNYTKFINNEAH